MTDAEYIEKIDTVSTDQLFESLDYYGCDSYYADLWNATINELKKRVTPQGEWIKGQEISRMMIANEVQHIEYKDYTCSNCGLVLDNLLYHYDGSPFYKFCPNCGAKMKGGAE